MKLKTVIIEGKTYAVINEQGHPVYVHDDGKEVGFDAPRAISKIDELGNESKNHRLAKEQAEASLKAFEGIDDPAAAKKAIETLKNFDDKKLVDAGEVEKVKAEAIKAVEEKYAPIVKERDDFQAQLHNELIGGGFARSKYIQDNLSVPADLIQAQFGKNFKIEEGKVIAYGPDGQKIFSRARPGEVADFDEALESLVGGYQFKDSILKPSQASGGGFQGKGGQGGVTAKSLADCKTEAEKIAYLKQVGEQN
ncbi:DUF6651 domain-containing protein [Acinetobacter baumannii]|uniref:DUF6651 domain-containing protein n=1 Tax=Acinetobacter calcoaceticus/baumannii complex TaxID=909768 RepID=UPI000DE7122D|nr:DUF6651 domain-containing protein [Acinetobacter nosocomialis]MCU4453053.1 hypothetical protein [Acinetobacter nosocomialis]MCU4575066.1 hypothetical protein [Acinetobacter nosocomialis]MCU4593780.1 hypothetical protein [Acinetobacter nosocomialis]SSV40333.1 Uncharacterised protein [Acinetobacter nosocomialis]